MAGNLALSLLAQEAAALDNLLKQVRVPETKHIDAFELRLHQTATSIQAWLNDLHTSPATSKSATEYPELQTALGSIRNAIEHSQFIDHTDLQGYSQQIPACGRDDWEALCQALDNFEYDNAKQHLENLLNTLSEGKNRSCSSI